MKVLYTAAAKRELERFKDAQAEKLEELVKEEKFLFGDDEIEITASDLREAEKSVRIERRPGIQKRKIQTMVLAFRVYAVLGLLMMIVGAFYSNLMQLMHAIEANPKQAILTLGGGALSIVSILMLYLLRARQRRYEFLDEREAEVRLRKLEHGES